MSIFVRFLGHCKLLIANCSMKYILAHFSFFKSDLCLTGSVQTVF